MKLLPQITRFLRKHQILLLLIFTLSITTFFRLYKISNIPFGLNNDAAYEGSAAADILRGNINPYLPYAAEGWRGEGIIRLIVAINMIFLGHTSLSIKVASAIFGIALVIPLFFLIKNLFGTKFACLTTFFIAISGWHITMSKSGWRAITVPLFATLTFYYLHKGLHSRKYKDFILCGIFLSICSLYTYDAARIIPFFFLGCVLFLSMKKRHFLTIYKNHLKALVFASLIIAIPMLFYATHNWENFTSRSRFLGIDNQIKQAGNISPLWNNIVTSALLFNVKANGNDFFLSDPLVENPVGFFIPIGIIITLWQVLIKHKKNYLFMFVWFVASLLPGVLSIPNGNRAIGAIPAIYFFVAVGVLFFCDIARSLRINTYVILSIVILFCTICAYQSYYNYIGPSRRELYGFHPEVLVNCAYLNTIRNQYTIYIDPGPIELLTFYLEDPKKPFYNNFTKTANYQFVEIAKEKKTEYSATKNAKGIAFVLSPQDSQIAQRIQNEFNVSSRLVLWYNNELIHRPASIIILIPPYSI